MYHFSQKTLENHFTSTLGMVENFSKNLQNLVHKLIASTLEVVTSEINILHDDDYCEMAELWALFLAVFCNQNQSL